MSNPHTSTAALPTSIGGGGDAGGVQYVEENDTMQPHTNPDYVLETKEDDTTLNSHITQLSRLIKKSKSVVVMTGAGVSTGTGIPDYRGPSGKWTLVQRLQTSTDEAEKDHLRSLIIEGNVAYQHWAEMGKTGVTHRALQAIMEAGYIKTIISTNIDGLHRASGVHPKQLSELHGNSRRARCDTCTKYASADSFLMRCDAEGDPLDVHGQGSHVLGPCVLTPNCTGQLQDTIVHFGENLASEVQEAADASSEDVDCLICLGTSLRIISCSAMMHVGTNQGKYVIVNLQKTEYDSRAKIRIFHDCDTVMMRLAEALGVIVPEPTVTRQFVVSWNSTKSTISFVGQDEIGEPFIFATKLEIVNGATGEVLQSEDMKDNSNLIDDVASGKKNPWKAIEFPLPNTNDSSTAGPLVLRWHSRLALRLPPCDIPLHIFTSNKEKPPLSAPSTTSTLNADTSSFGATTMMVISSITFEASRQLQGTTAPWTVRQLSHQSTI